MKIQEMFERQIDRDLQGVIMVGQDDQNNKQQELEEYVVTRELQNHFSTFFENYTYSIDHPTEKMGAWIDGFFGSGKSHFLKILSYLLENEEVLGQNAIDYFKKGQKINDPHTMLQIEKAASVPTDVVLFNIDSKAVAKSKDEENVILKVFQRVFNELRGYYGMNQNIADLENRLLHIGKYEAFKSEFARLSQAEGRELDWEEGRSHYAFSRGKIQQALVNSGAMSVDDAQGFVDGIDNERELSIEDFANEVKAYLDEKGSNHRIAFLVDEVGQFIGDNVNKMLNLQTIVEELGMKCQGRAWVIVTSQQKIDEVVDVKNGKADFSKIQGRFNTRISMSSANVDEVIKKRLLEKKATAKSLLRDTYSSDGTSLNNKIDFKGNKKIYANIDSEETFIETYPFIPYQFELLQNVLEAVRLHGSDGKHLSEGERSMLGIFKESAMRYEDRDNDTVVPFSAFFAGLVNFLDHNHRATILRAEQDDFLDDEDRDFTIDVLKTLFMVKYVDSFKSTIDNITTLMIETISGTREEVKQRVKHAVKKLEAQNYILKNADDAYEFLTDVEQDINNEIQGETVEDSEIVAEISREIIGNSFIESKYTYAQFGGKYVFDINRYVDDTAVGSNRGKIDIKLYTVLSDTYNDEYTLETTSSYGDKINIKLPEKDNYVDDIRQYLKIDKYLRKHNQGETSAKDEVIRSKRLLSKDIKAKLFGNKKNPGIVGQALNEATIYNSGVAIKNGKSFEVNLKEQEEEAVRQTYRYLDYIQVTKSARDILEVFKKSGLDIATPENIQAINLVFDKGIKEVNSLVNLQSLLTRFKDAPYGYHEEDVTWILAKLFMDGRVRVELNRERLTVSDANKDPQRYLDYFTKKANKEKLTFEAQKEINPKQLKAAKEFATEFLGMTKQAINAETTNEGLMQVILTRVRNRQLKLKGYLSEHPKYAGDDIINRGIDLYQEVLDSEVKDNFFEHLALPAVLDDFDEWEEAMESRGIRDFYTSDAKLKIWGQMLTYMDRYERNEAYLANNLELKKIYDQYQGEKKKNNPGKTLPTIKGLNDTFRDRFNDYVDSEYETYKKALQDSKNKLAGRLEQANFENSRHESMVSELNAKYSSYKSIGESAAEKGDVSRIFAEKSTLENYEKNFLSRIEEFSKVDVQPPAIGPDPEGGNGDDIVTPSVKPKVTVSRSITQITHTNTWKLESQADVDRYISSLKQALESELKEADIVNVDF
ncbi:BREX system P-loop protein BrxC [Ligilactobacillus equi]